MLPLPPIWRFPPDLYIVGIILISEMVFALRLSFT